MSSTLVRCRRGHCYDDRRHTACPYCGVSLPQMPVTMGRPRSAGASLDAESDGAAAPSPERERTATPRPRDRSVPPGGDVTLAYWGRSGFDPLVGWLVCIEGPGQGRDYRIRQGNNRIGRDEAMDIVIRRDTAISRERQVLIAYDGRSTRFLIREGDARGLISVNGEAITGTVALEAWDVLEIGRSRFCFVPLCGEHFRWRGAGS